MGLEIRVARGEDGVHLVDRDEDDRFDIGVAFDDGLGAADGPFGGVDFGDGNPAVTVGEADDIEGGAAEPEVVEHEAAPFAEVEEDGVEGGAGVGAGFELEDADEETFSDSEEIDGGKETEGFDFAVPEATEQEGGLLLGLAVLQGGEAQQTVGGARGGALVVVGGRGLGGVHGLGGRGVWAAGRWLVGGGMAGIGERHSARALRMVSIAVSLRWYSASSAGVLRGSFIAL